jgi:hypothetical protein
MIEGGVTYLRLVNDVVVQVLHAEQHGTGHKSKCLSLSLLSPGKEQSNTPKYCYFISLREVVELADMLNEFAQATNSKMR